MAGFAEYKGRKLERLRLGQSTCEIHTLSDEETRIALVPLTEGEYSNSLHEADKLMVSDGPSGFAYRDEIQRQWILFYACREVSDLENKFFEKMDQVGELDKMDVNALYDLYLEMVATTSPSLMGLSEEDFADLKDLLPRIEWSALSGPAWYAADRFLRLIQPQLLMDRSSGL